MLIGRRCTLGGRYSELLLPTQEIRSFKVTFALEFWDDIFIVVDIPILGIWVKRS